MSATSNGKVLNDWFKHLARTKPASTIYQYSRDTHSYACFLNGKSMLSATVQDMNGWLDRPRRGGRTAAPATVKREAMVLRSLYRYLHEQAELIARNPAVKIETPKVDNEDPHPVDEDVWLTTWAQALPDDMRVALGLGYFCGLRRHEITLLRAEQFCGPRIVDLKRKGGKKTGFPWQSCVDLYAARLPRLIGNPQSTFLAPLERLLVARAGRPALLPWDDNKSPRHRTYVVHDKPKGMIDPAQFNKRLARMKLAFSPHDLRHSFCTNLVLRAPRGAGIPVEIVSKLAGHADLRVTMRYLSLGDDPLADFLRPQPEDDEIPAVSRW